MISFTHDDKTVYVGPSATFSEADDLSLDTHSNKRANKSTNNDDKGKVLSIDGNLHLLFETRTTKSKQNIPLNKGWFPSH